MSSFQENPEADFDHVASTDDESVQAFEYREEPLVVSEPLEENPDTAKIDYSKTTMNVVNDPNRPSDFKPGSKTS